MKNGIGILLVLILELPLLGAQNTAPQALANLRTELEAIKADYEERITALEAQIEQLQIQMLRLQQRFHFYP